MSAVASLHHASTLPVAGLPSANAAELTTEIIAAFRQALGEHRYALWFESRIQITLTSPDQIQIATANEFTAKMLQNQQAALFQQVAAGVLKCVPALTVTVDPALRVAAPRAVPAPVPAPVAVPRTKVVDKHAYNLPMGERYNFEEFVIGPCNQMAYHAAMAVIQQPGVQFNPFFLHGASGLGKTHLLVAMCRQFQLRHPQKRVAYLTAEQFTNDYIEAIRSHGTEAFRRRLRQADLLIVDDVQFLANKKSTQNELLHTLNHMTLSGQQLVLASDVAPTDLASMAPALTSRFSAGMVVRLDSPDVATRLEILRRKACRQGVTVRDTVMAQIAQNCNGSIRELEGLWLRALAGMEMHHGNPQLMRRLLHQQTATTAVLTLPEIMQEVAQYFALTVGSLTHADRRRHVSMARSIAMFLARAHTRMSYAEIAGVLGGKNHSTVVAGCQRIQAHKDTAALISWPVNAQTQSAAMPDVLRQIEHQLRQLKLQHND